MVTSNVYTKHPMCHPKSKFYFQLLFFTNHVLSCASPGGLLLSIHSSEPGGSLGTSKHQHFDPKNCPSNHGTMKLGPSAQLVGFPTAGGPAIATNQRLEGVSGSNFPSSWSGKLSCNQTNGSAKPSLIINQHPLGCCRASRFAEGFCARAKERIEAGELLSGHPAT